MNYAFVEKKIEISKFKIVGGGHFKFMLESYFHFCFRLKRQKYEEI